MKCLVQAGTILCVILHLFSPLARSQSSSTLTLTHRSDISSDCAHLTMTMMADQMGRPFLYIAAKEAGLLIYDLSTLESPQFVTAVPITGFENLQVMNLDQSGNFVFLAIGSHFLQGQTPGIAVVDVTDPLQAYVSDYWVLDQPSGGAGVVKVEGNYAYLGAMEHGLITLDVSDENDIRFVSQFIPDITYPEPNPDPEKYNARGMVVREGIVYLAYDAGGLRVIDVTDEMNPIEIGRYSNPLLNSLPRAYNNLVLDDSLAYITADYCGLEVLDISDPGQISQVAWWNPWTCQTSPLNWFISPGHTNEIAIDRDHRLLFMSTGKSDLYIVDIHDPSRPDSYTVFGGIENNIGTWGVSRSGNTIFLSYICAFIPFASNWSGVKVLTYDISTPVIDPGSHPIRIFPNPASSMITVDIPGEPIASKPAEITVLNQTCEKVVQMQLMNQNPLRVNVSEIPPGMYFLFVKTRGESFHAKFLKFE